MLYFLSNIPRETVNNKTKSKLKISDDGDLMPSVVKGDYSAFEKLVERHKKRAFFAALGMVGDAETAHDLSQDAWVAAFRAIGSFRLGSPFYPWFYRILMNLCKNSLRRRSIEGKIFAGSADDDDAPEYAGNVLAPECLVEERELKEAVWKAIEALPPEQKEAIILAHFENLSYVKIAELLGVPIGTVMSRLYYARKKLASLMEGSV